MEERKSKEFIFPENIQKDYGIVLGLGLKDIILYMLPTCLIAIGILFFPVTGLTAFLIKALIAMLLVVLVLAVVTTNPIKERQNIRLPKYMQMKRNYSKKQHLYFKSKKSSKEIGGR